MKTSLFHHYKYRSVQKAKKYGFKSQFYYLIIYNIDIKSVINKLIQEATVYLTMRNLFYKEQATLKNINFYYYIYIYLSSFIVYKRSLYSTHTEYIRFNNAWKNKTFINRRS